LQEREERREKTYISAAKTKSRVRYTTTKLFPDSTPITDDAETTALVIRYQRHSDFSARDALVAGHWKLIWRETSRFIRPTHENFMEAYNEAILGFDNACRKIKLENSQGTKSKTITYLMRAASFAVVAYMQQVDNTFGVSPGEARRLRQEWIEELEEHDPHSPMLPVLRRRQTSKIIYDIMHRVIGGESVEADAGRLSTSADEYLRGNEAFVSPSTNLAHEDQKRFVSACMEVLKGRERDVIEMRNGFKQVAVDPYSKTPGLPGYDFIGRLPEYGVSGTRVKNIENSGLERIRKQMKKMKLNHSDLL
jgi:RNA polymerase sigma factor (sigma-70 family)